MRAARPRLPRSCPPRRRSPSSTPGADITASAARHPEGSGRGCSRSAAFYGNDANFNAGAANLTQTAAPTRRQAQATAALPYARSAVMANRGARRLGAAAPSGDSASNFVRDAALLSLLESPAHTRRIRLAR